MFVSVVPTSEIHDAMSFPYPVCSCTAASLLRAEHFNLTNPNQSCD